MGSGIAIIDVEMTQFSEYWKKDRFDLAWEVGKTLLDRTGYHRAGVDLFSIAGDISEYEKSKFRQNLGVEEKEIQFCGGTESGVLALNYAIRSIKSGECKVAFVGSSEKSMNTGSEHDNNNLLKIGQGWFVEAGKIKMQLMNNLKVTEESLAGIPVKAHFQGFYNPKAQYQRIISRENVLNSPFVRDAKPLRDYEKSFENSCGAVGMILCDEDEARKHEKPVYIEGYGTSQYADIEHCYSIPSIRMAVERACKNVVKPSDLSLLQVSDSATPLEAVILSNILIPQNELEEILKNTFKNADEPKKQVPSWPYALDKPVFVNTDGGDKAAGFPGSPTSYHRRVSETVEQLQGKAGKRQVLGLSHGLTVSINDYRSMSISSHLFGVR
jgi:acetyl-CoA C-acetyltransferase